MFIDCKSTNFRYVERRPNVEAYVRDVRDYQVLSADEQLQLLELTKSEDNVVKQKAIDKLVETNQRFVFSVAKKYANSENILDLTSEGNIGLIKAIERFDPNSGNRFLTYAVWWIRRYISDFIIQNKSFVKCNNSLRFARLIPKVKNELFVKLGREPSFEEVNELLQEKYDCKMQDESDYEGVYKYELDIEYNGEADYMQNADTIYNQKTATDNVSEDIDNSYIKEFTDFLISKLTEREKDIVSKRYGIGCAEMTVTAIAEEYNVSGNTIRNILNKAKNKMKEYEDYD